MIDITELKLLEKNPRKISVEAMEKLKESIERDPEYMENRPIIADKNGTVWGGNQRLKACLDLGKNKVPDSWVRFVDWPEDKLRRFALVDNGPEAMSGENDLEILTEWAELDFGDFDFADFGFDFYSSDEIIDFNNIDGGNKQTTYDKLGEKKDNVLFEFGEIKQSLPVEVYENFIEKIDTGKVKESLISELIK